MAGPRRLCVRDVIFFSRAASARFGHRSRAFEFRYDEVARRFRLRGTADSWIRQEGQVILKRLFKAVTASVILAAT